MDNKNDQIKEDIKAPNLHEEMMVQNPAILEVLEAIDILDFEEFLQPVKIDGRETIDWTAEGIKCFALLFKVSVGPIDIQDNPNDNDGVMMQAQAHSEILDISAPAIITQGFDQKTKKSSRPDAHWAAKGSARVTRNARKQLLPVELLKAKLKEAVSQNESFEEEIEDLKDQTSKIWGQIESSITPLTKKDCLNEAESVYGLIGKWDQIMWKQFMVDLENFNENYLGERRDEKIDVMNSEGSENDETDDDESNNDDDRE